MPGPTPQLVALLLCDRAFQEAGTLKWHVSGAFDAINAGELPITVPQVSVFVALSDFGGDAMVELVIRDEEGGVVKAVRAKIPRIPLGLFQYVFPFPDVEFRNAGVHTLELLVGDDVVALRSFRVQQTTIDRDAELRQSEELVEQYREQLAKDVRDVWEKHPEAEAVGLIASAQAAATPWFRQSFEALTGSPPPQMTFVGILDRNSILRLVGSHSTEEVETWLASQPKPAARVLPVLIVMQSGFRFTTLEIEPFA